MRVERRLRRERTRSAAGYLPFRRVAGFLRRKAALAAKAMPKYALPAVAAIILQGLVSGAAYAAPERAAGGKWQNLLEPDTTVTNETHVTVTDSKAIGEWSSLNTLSGESLKFGADPSLVTGSWTVLNRVTGSSPTQFDGKLSTNLTSDWTTPDPNGHVFIYNPNGIVFGDNAQVNVGGLIATTKNIKDADFHAGDYEFAGNYGTAGGVVNNGHIFAQYYVVLFGDSASHTGSITVTGNGLAGIYGGFMLQMPGYWSTPYFTSISSGRENNASVQ